MGGTLKNPERQLGGIGHFIRRGAELYPARIAIDDLLNGRRLTYAELDARINRLARALTRLGIGRGDIVAAMMWNEHALVETIFACARIGAIVAPLNVRLIAGEVSDYVNEHGCIAVIASADFTDRFADATAPLRIVYGTPDATEPAQGWRDYEALISAEDGAVLPVVTSLDDPYRLVMTGGTTGKSKGVLHSQGGTIVTALADIAEYGIRRGWQTMTILPAYHVAGMEWGMFTIFWRAGTVVFPADKSFNPARYLDEVRRRGIEYLPLVPAVIKPLHDAWDGQPLTAPRTVVTTASATPLAQRELLAEMFPDADILAAAGLSESLNMATQGAGEFLTHPTGIGEPHVDTRMLILDDDDRPVPPGTPGHMALRNFNTALGYHNNEDASAVTWRKRKNDPEGLHWCFTGDIGVMDADGRFSIVDRTKDVIITGGESVPSIEVEAVYAGHPDIRESSVIGIADERWGEAILLVAVPADTAAGGEPALADALIAFGRERLSGYKVPRKIAFVDALPRSHFGKVLKRDLREQDFERLYGAS